MEDFKINLEEIKTWIDALRSGNYKQTRKVLQNSKGFCCLGVACDVFIPEDKKNKTIGKRYLIGNMPTEQPNAPDWLKKMDSDFEKKTGRYLTSLNDHFKFTFMDIADVLEEVYITNTFKTFKI
jgi:hypothetical protein